MRLAGVYAVVLSTQWHRLGNWVPALKSPIGARLDAHSTRLIKSAGNEAGDAFVQLAGVHTKLESPHDAAMAWVEAGKAYLKLDHRSECFWLC